MHIASNDIMVAVIHTKNWALNSLSDDSDEFNLITRLKCLKMTG